MPRWGRNALVLVGPMVLVSWPVIGARGSDDRGVFSAVLVAHMAAVVAALGALAPSVRLRWAVGSLEPARFVMWLTVAGAWGVAWILALAVISGRASFARELLAGSTAVSLLALAAAATLRWMIRRTAGQGRRAKPWSMFA